ncbi:hypothetical protein C8J57DRAFT_1086746, partial [Mycena rebaudengoi]
VPVYTVWGACEDVLVIEKFRSGSYVITSCLDLGGVKLRLLGLSGALKMFDNGDGNTTIAGGLGTMWTTALQIGELIGQRCGDGQWVACTPLRRATAVLSGGGGS